MRSWMSLEHRKPFKNGYMELWTILPYLNELTFSLITIPGSNTRNTFGYDMSSFKFLMNTNCCSVWFPSLWPPHLHLCILPFTGLKYSSIYESHLSSPLTVGLPVVEAREYMDMWPVTILTWRNTPMDALGDAYNAWPDHFSPDMHHCQLFSEPQVTLS